MSEIEALQKNEVNPKLETSLVRGNGVDIFKLNYFDGVFVEQCIFVFNLSTPFLNRDNGFGCASTAS